MKSTTCDKCGTTEPNKDLMKPRDWFELKFQQGQRTTLVHLCPACADKLSIPNAILDQYKKTTAEELIEVLELFVQEEVQFSVDNQ